jgi:uncharacterized membrane protein
MKIILMTICALLSGPSFSETTQVEFVKNDPYVKAMEVIQNKCFSCHRGQWKNYTTSEQWVTARLIKPADFRGSEIIHSLKNYGGDMPFTTKLVVTRPELRILKKWIDSLK